MAEALAKAKAPRPPGSHRWLCWLLCIVLLVPAAADDGALTPLMVVSDIGTWGMLESSIKAAAGKKAVALLDKDGRTLAILHNPEVYENRKEEVR